ncbi:MAG: formylglycine-generating enzyme family protein [Candidatus Cloacimonetes bacterium]|jgi:formylglycine-generating enzyme required for sulfatase activity|nr:formylglycine-generating enzyme family protein [Candidatus Cloacimonadota bacterium]NLO44831.1 formylglycine-generating enzyme family protein [Candidatus Cloacimonadota bacterium]
MKKFKSIVLVIFTMSLIVLIFSCGKKTTEPETTKVATPIISPSTGIYDEAQEVSIQCSTKDALIRYTADGSIPNASSLLYSEPIVISSSTTIIAQAFKYGWTDSDFASAIFTIPPNPEDVGMVYLSGGTFTMGKTNYEVEMDPMWDNDMSPHSVTLDSYYINKYQVTQAEYEDIMGSNPAFGKGEGDNYPVYNVSWYDAIKYCNLRSMREGLTPVYLINGSTDPAHWGEVPTESNYAWKTAIWLLEANGYRLPTEAEWEYAARGATNDPDYLYSGSGNIDEVAWYSMNSDNSTHPVGGKAANGLGLYDMNGNVSEWCWDWSENWYGYYSTGYYTNPTGPANGVYRMKRGGCWGSAYYDCRVASRSDAFPYVRSHFLGFRVCRSAN